MSKKHPIGSVAVDTYLAMVRELKIAITASAIKHGFSTYTMLVAGIEAITSLVRAAHQLGYVSAEELVALHEALTVTMERTLGSKVAVERSDAPPAGESLN